MKSRTYPVALPDDLYSELKRTAEKTRLTMADVLRQSLAIGMPVLRHKISQAEELKPFTKEECRQAWEVPDPEFDRFAGHCAKLPIRPQEGD